MGDANTMPLFCTILYENQNRAIILVDSHIACNFDHVRCGCCAAKISITVNNKVLCRLIYDNLLNSRLCCSSIPVIYDTTTSLVISSTLSASFILLDVTTDCDDDSAEHHIVDIILVHVLRFHLCKSHYPNKKPWIIDIS